MIPSSLITPGIDLHTTNEIINLSVTCFVIGFGIGPLVFAPLSEYIGRKWIYSISIGLYFLFTLPSALARNAATLIVARQVNTSLRQSLPVHTNKAHIGADCRISSLGTYV